MNDDLLVPLQALRPARPESDIAAVLTAVPAAALTASVLADVGALFADNPADARAYARRAVDSLKIGLTASLAGFALTLLDTIGLPGTTVAGKRATGELARDGALAAIYLLGLAAREKQLTDFDRSEARTDIAPIGLSLAGLVLLLSSGKVKLPQLPGM